jgi:microcystin degradation protein MlrC
MKKYRIAYARLFHETHSFSPEKTTLKEFRERELHEGSDLLEHYRGSKTETGAFIDFIEKNDFEAVPLIAGAANPSGLVSADAYAFFKERIVEGLQGIRDEIDALFLSLHGAMIVEGVPDAEGDLLNAIREVIPELPLAASMDLHANVSPDMVARTDMIAGYKTYPHVDQYETGRRALHMLHRHLNGERRFRNVLLKMPLLLPSMNMMTDAGPMADLVNRGLELEQTEGIGCVSVFGGFPYSDLENAGFSVVVSVEEGREKEAARILDEMAKLSWEKRREFIVELPTAEEAIHEALQEKEGVVALVDVSDNPGSGGFAETTILLETLLKTELPKTAFAFISDPEAVQHCIEAGVGEDVDLLVGGKISTLYGEPVRVRGRVKTISDGIYYNKGPWNTGIRVNFGRTVVLSIGTIDLLLSEGRQSPNDPEVFRRNGMEPTEYRILALKAKNHFRAGFKDIVTKVIPLDAPGVASLALGTFPYRNIPRPVFPLDEDVRFEQMKVFL